MAIDALLARYPKSRPPLPAPHERVYVEHYRFNRAGTSGVPRLSQKLEAWMHRRVARGSPAKVLELGAGTLNHVPYHPGATIYDAVEPFRELWQDSPHRARVRHIYADVQEVPETERYDAVLSVAVLEHLTNLPQVVAQASRRLREGGVFRAAFPSEGGMLWGLAWRFTTGLEFRLKHGLDYASLMRHEHVNTAAEIIGVLRHFFERVEISRFPAGGKHLSFYTAAEASGPRGI